MSRYASLLNIVNEINDINLISNYQKLEGTISKKKIYSNIYFSDITLIKVLKGNIHFESKNEKIKITEGNIIYIGHNCYHSVIFEKGDTILESIDIKMGFVSSHIKITTLFHNIINFSDDRYILQYFEQVCSLINLTDGASQLLYQGVILMLLGEILTRVEAIDDLALVNNNLKLQYICQYIRENYDKKITLDILSNKFGYTPQYISTLFKQELNTTFLNYLTYKRLEKAKYLLVSTNKKIIDIAYLCGFSDERRFIMRFKNRYGFTPAQFRKK